MRKSLKDTGRDGNHPKELKISEDLRQKSLEELNGGGGQAILRCGDMSQKIVIAQKPYTGGGGKITHFLTGLCLLFPKSLKWNGSICIPSKILASLLGKICHDGVVVFT